MRPFFLGCLFVVGYFAVGAQLFKFLGNPESAQPATYGLTAPVVQACETQGGIAMISAARQQPVLVVTCYVPQEGAQ